MHAPVIGYLTVDLVVAVADALLLVPHLGRLACLCLRENAIVASLGIEHSAIDARGRVVGYEALALARVCVPRGLCGGASCTQALIALTLASGRVKRKVFNARGVGAATCTSILEPDKGRLADLNFFTPARTGVFVKVLTGGTSEFCSTFARATRLVPCVWLATAGLRLQALTSACFVVVVLTTATFYEQSTGTSALAVILGPGLGRDTAETALFAGAAAGGVVKVLEASAVNAWTLAGTRNGIFDELWVGLAAVNRRIADTLTLGVVKNLSLGTGVGSALCG